MSPRRALPLAALLAALAAPAAAQQAAAPAAGLTLEQVVRATLASSAALRDARLRVQASEGALRQAGAAFDPVLAAAARSTRAPASLTGGATTTESGYDLGISQRLPWGATVAPRLTFQRSTERTGGTLPQNLATAALDLTLPLLRGRGGGIDAAVARSARLEVEAAGADLQGRRGDVLLRAAEAYWAYAAAVRRVEVLRGAEARAERLVADTRALVAADERPAADTLPVAASAASKRAARIAAEQEVTAARRELAVAMGTPAAQAPLAAPATAFPAPDAAAVPGPAQASALALAARPELAAARGRRDAALALARGARGDTRTRLDLSLGFGYTGVEAGTQLGRFVSPFYSTAGGPQASFGVSWSLPWQNREAAGRLMQAEAALRQAENELDEAGRQLALEAAAAAETLARSADELAQSAEAARLHAAAVQGEREKFRLGTSTLMDVLYAEDALTSATLAEIGGRQRYAQALARLRYQTGALQREGADDSAAAGLVRWSALAAR
jgi:outer membrane protein TolC